MLDFGQPAAAGRGQRHRVTAPVRRGAAPFDEVVGLQLVEQRDHVGGIQPERRGQVGLVLFAEIPQQRQRDDVARAQTGRRELGLRVGLHPPRQVHEQRPREVHVRQRTGIHRRSIWYR